MLPARSLATDARWHERRWHVQDVHSRFELLHHLLQLDDDDRRLRFGAALADASVAAYVKQIDVRRDRIFGAYNNAGRLIGTAHLARIDPDAELGISVLKPYRHRGIGNALLQRAAAAARQWHVRRLFMHYLSENEAIAHLARSNGMTLERAHGEADAWLAL